MARQVKLVPVSQPKGAREVTLRPVDVQQPGITRAAGAETGAPLRQETFGGRFFQDLVERVGGIVQAATSPKQTIKTLGNLGTGAVIKSLRAAGQETIPIGVEEDGSDALTSLLGDALSKQFPEAEPTAEAAGAELAGEVDRIVTDPVGAFSEKPVSTVLSVGAVVAPTLRATGLGKFNVIGRAATKPRRAIGKALERKTTNITRRLAGDLGVSPDAIDIVRKNSPDFQGAVTGQIDDVALLQRAQEATTGARNALNTEFRGRLQALGIDDPVDLRIAQTKFDSRLEGFGIKRGKNGKLKSEKLRGGLTADDQKKLREWVESNVDDQVTQNPIVSLDEAERFRQERIRDTRPIMDTQKGQQVIDSFIGTYNDAVESVKPGFKQIAKDFAPRFDRLDKDLIELGLKSKGKEGTKINSLLLVAKKGEDVKSQALQRIEELSGVNVSDLATGRQIARTIDKPTKTARGIQDRLTQFVSEFGETPADIAEGLASPTLAARAGTAGGNILQKLGAGLQQDPGGALSQTLINSLRGLQATEEERKARAGQ